MAIGILEAISKLRRFQLQNNDDFFDRLSRRYSVILLILFTIIISTKQYVGDPISCWAPAQFTAAHVEYTNYICWISNTYYLSFNEKIPRANEAKLPHISYYQWVPFILLTQAILFHLPSIVWHSVTTQSGFDIASLVKIVNSIEHFNVEAREKSLRFVAKHIHKALELQREIPTSTIVSQLFLLNHFLGNSYNLYGLEVVRNLFNTTAALTSFTSPAPESPRFPRITMCHFQVRFLGDNVHDYVVQCALTVNLFNEKIFLFIWFWLVYVSFISIYGFFLWIWYSLWWNRMALLKQYLNLIKNREKYDRKLMHTFCHHFLRHDGALVLRLIGQNSNSVIMGEIISAMWDYFRQSKEDGSLFV